MTFRYRDVRPGDTVLTLFAQHINVETVTYQDLLGEANPIDFITVINNVRYISTGITHLEKR